MHSHAVSHETLPNVLVIHRSPCTNYLELQPTPTAVNITACFFASTLVFDVASGRTTSLNTQSHVSDTSREAEGHRGKVGLMVC